MVIVFVVDDYSDVKNGTSMTAHRFVEGLRQRGHEVRILAISQPGEDSYCLREHHYGPVNALAHQHGFRFAKFDEQVARKALEGADIVHFLLPMLMEIQVRRLAEEMGIPCSAAFHMQPENATHILHIAKVEQTNTALYKMLYHVFYKHFRHIHCPSAFIAGELKKHGYGGKLYVISNGVDDAFVPPKEEIPADPDRFHILMTGRLSPEKRQEVLIEAVRRSKYRDKIQIHFAGAGTGEHHLRRLGSTLPNPPTIDFYSQEALIDRIHHCDLYVHTATVEIEAIACLEALSCGLVPVICNSKKSATVQFALDSRSLFRADDPVDLANKIDYWIEHPEEKAAMAKSYAALGNRYRVSESVKKAEYLFRETIADDWEERYG
jgi:glycosyltransferase involved in cell wall biosynthesis